MRYTTVIDIREMRSLYANKNAVLLYLHLCLSCGYHAEDTDIYRVSLRVLAREVGLTFSALRHGLKCLVKAGVLEVMDDGALKVLHYVAPADIPKRKAEKLTKEEERQKVIDDERRKREDVRKKMDDDFKAGRTGPLGLLQYLEEKGARGDSKAKKEALALRQELHSNGVL